MDDTAEPSFDYKHFYGHIAVRRKDYIVVVLSRKDCTLPEIWIYNLWTEQWKKCQLLNGNGIPVIDYQTFGVEIRSGIYIFDSYSFQHMWKLIPLKDDLFQLSKISVGNADKSLSPRLNFCVWTFGDKIWIFGGLGIWTGTDGYIDTYGDFDRHRTHYMYAYNNQLFSCDLSIFETWTNVECLGDVPSPRSHASSAIINEKGWLYGGSVARGLLHDLYELNILSLTWTQINISTSMPMLMMSSTITVTAATAYQLVVRGVSLQTRSFGTWIVNTKSNHWEEYSVSGEKCYNCFYKATTGLTCDVINIVAHSSVCKCHKSALLVMLEPRSLQQLAMKIIHEYRTTLPWQSLPQSLICKLMAQLIK